MKRKNLTALALALALLFTLAACGAAPAETPAATEAPAEPAEAPVETTEAPAAPVTVRLAALTGPTAMGMAKIFADADAGTAANDYEISLYGAADELTPQLLQGGVDIAAVPLNLASVLYNKTSGGVKLCAVGVLGVLYITEFNGSDVQSLADLKGKTIYATGKGSVPEYFLRYLLAENGLDLDTDVTVEWKSEPNEVVALLKAENGGIAMLPQPYVTAAQMKDAALRVVLDLTKEWNKVCGTQLITGVIAPESGTVRLKGDRVAVFDPNGFIEHGVSHVPEDRNLQGLIGDMSIAENLVLKDTDDPRFSHGHGLRLNKRAIHAYAQSMMEKYDVRATSDSQSVRELSGGNQQKVIIARELESGPSVLVMAHPTRGLDIGATSFVHDQMIAARARGVGILLISADFDEILEMSDRIVVCFEGRIMGEFSGSKPPINEISLAMTGK